VDFLKLIKGLREMVINQARGYTNKVAQEVTTIKYEHMNKQYLGDLPMAVSLRALSLITEEKRYAQEAVDDDKEEWDCDEDCTTWLQYRVPCRHTIFKRLRGQEPLTLQDLHPRWLLDKRLDEDRHIRIRDPHPAEARRGRPRNDPVPVDREFVPQY
jgi:hypothetical protein